MCCISFFSGKAEIMSSRRPSTQYYERRNKNCRDVDADEGSSRDVPSHRSTREEHIVESSEDDDVDDENYRICPREAILHDDDVEDELRRRKWMKEGLTLKEMPKSPSVPSQH
jgi:hypothetical protein